jgi:hypothetical protein
MSTRPVRPPRRPATKKKTKPANRSPQSFTIPGISSGLIYITIVLLYLGVLGLATRNSGRSLTTLFQTVPPAVHALVLAIALLPALATRHVLRVSGNAEAGQFVARRRQYLCGIPVSSSKLDLSGYQSLRIRQSPSALDLVLSCLFLMLTNPFKFSSVNLPRYTVTLSGYHQKPLILARRTSRPNAQAMAQAIQRLGRFDIV